MIWKRHLSKTILAPSGIVCGFISLHTLSFSREWSISRAIAGHCWSLHNEAPFVAPPKTTLLSVSRWTEFGCAQRGVMWCSWTKARELKTDFWNAFPHVVSSYFLTVWIVSFTSRLYRQCFRRHFGGKTARTCARLTPPSIGAGLRNPWNHGFLTISHELSLVFLPEKSCALPFFFTLSWSSLFLSIFFESILANFISR